MHQKTTICEWFDPENIEHIRAYEVLQETGAWPENFIPDHIEFEIMNQVNVIVKMGNYWIAHMKSLDKK